MGKAYQRHEAEEILRRALVSHQGEAISREDLLAAAAEVGLTPEAIERAELELAEEGRRSGHRKRLLLKRRQRFARHILTFLGVISTLLAINLVLGGPIWFYYPALFWSIPLVLHAIHALVPGNAGVDREVERAMRREARMAKQRTQGGPATTVTKVQQLLDGGLDLLLGRLAEQLEQGKPKVRVDTGRRPSSSSKSPLRTPPPNQATTGDQEQAETPAEGQQRKSGKQ